MNESDRMNLSQVLRQRREELFKEVAATEADLQFIAEDRESELIERAQEADAARLFERLDARGKQEIEETDAALRRIADGTYGICLKCGKRIPTARLRALPATPFCVDCARSHDPTH